MARSYPHALRKSHFTMTLPHSEPEGRPTRSPPRTHGTPSGYRNIRVLVPICLHYRMAGYAALSHASIPEFISRWLTLVTPLDPLTGRPVAADHLAVAPALDPGQIAQARPSPGSRPSATNISQGATPRPEATPGPSGGPPAAQGPGKTQPQGAGASSAPIPGTDPTSIGSLPTVSPDGSDPGQGENLAEAEGHINV